MRDVSASDAFELALIENIQREDLDRDRVRRGLQPLLDEHGYTQDSLAERIGKDRSTVANALRLLKLPPEVRQQVRDGELSEGHARALLGAGRTRAGARPRRQGGTRPTERAADRGPGASTRSAGGRGPKSSEPAGKTPAVRDLESRLAKHLGTKCEVRDKNGKGEIAIKYASLDELDRLLDLLL